MITQLTLICILAVMVLHAASITSGVLIIKKYETELQELSFANIFNVDNFWAHRLWFVLLSLVVSFGYLILGADLFLKAFRDLDYCAFKNILMNGAVAVLVLQYNFYILKDRRNLKE